MKTFIITFKVKCQISGLTNVNAVELPAKQVFSALREFERDKVEVIAVQYQSSLGSLLGASFSDVLKECNQ